VFVLGGSAALAFDRPWAVVLGSEPEPGGLRELERRTPSEIAAGRFQPHAPAPAATMKSAILTPPLSMRWRKSSPRFQETVKTQTERLRPPLGRWAGGPSLTSCAMALPRARSSPCNFICVRRDGQTDVAALDVAPGGS